MLSVWPGRSQGRGQKSPVVYWTQWQTWWKGCWCYLCVQQKLRKRPRWQSWQLGLQQLCNMTSTTPRDFQRHLVLLIQSPNSFRRWLLTLNFCSSLIAVFGQLWLAPCTHCKWWCLFGKYALEYLIEGAQCNAAHQYAVNESSSAELCYKN